MKSNFYKSSILSLACLALWSCTGVGVDEMVFIGDSLVAKWDVAEAFPGWITVNKGKSGCSVKYLDNFRGKMSGRNVTVIVGTNDSYLFDDAGIVQYAGQYLEIIYGLNASHVYLFSLLPRDYDSDSDGCNVQIKKFNALIKDAVALSENVTYIDVFDDFISDGRLDPGLYEPDMLHVNASGYALLRQKLFDSLGR